MLLYITAFASVGYVFWTLSKLATNYQKAQKLGFPIIVSPWGLFNIPWMVLQSLFLPLLDRTPLLWPIVNRRGWSWDGGIKMHQKIGKVFTHVTPDEIYVHVADAATCDRMVNDRKQIGRPIDNSQITLILGSNLISTEGPDWVRQRKIAQQAFIERNSSLVWTESKSQTEQMIEYWKETQPDGVRTVCHDLLTLGLHVLTHAGLGIQYQYRNAHDPPKAGYSMNYKDSLLTLLTNTTLLALFPMSWAKFPIWPKSVTTFTTAVSDFKRYMIEMVEAERERISCGKPERPSILSVLVSKNEEAKQYSREKPSAPLQGLRDDELYGNLFLFNLAGHETTTHTVGYALYMLAINPEYQTWAREEIMNILATHDQFDYENIFPKLRRTLALMFETLRLYPQVLELQKSAFYGPMDTTIADKQVTLPPEVSVQFNLRAMHQMSEYWGSDGTQFRPTRWISSPLSTAASSASGAAGKAQALAAEEIVKPPVKGAFMPWSEGGRVCPGKRFAQVEFLSVLMTVLRGYRLEIQTREGETVEGARERAQKVVDDSELVLTLEMRRAEDVAIKFVEIS
ncbi:cytochrome P450 [Aulographum hederae CBS 113979]|uniref:Cytochrome P450 n=1 Tax=Aulographum hederae CBS 113979 TaxID=1176131 RepID=A0A6G1GM62_9PEZI|nr:cytochrome P450 [Aulographum hederae CBS 113979]